MKTLSRTRPEDKIRQEITTWMRRTYPDVFFMHDMDKKSGIGNLSNYSQGVLSGMPDLMIYKPVGSYHGLFIEEKTEKGDPFKVMPRKKCLYIENKDKLGLLTEHAHHLRQQAYRIHQLNESGYFACFGVGTDQIKDIIRTYLKGHPMNTEHRYEFKYKASKYKLQKPCSIPIWNNSK